MLSKECETEMYVKEKEKYEMFLKYAKTKCQSEMRKYVKLKKMLVALERINDQF